MATTKRVGKKTPSPVDIHVGARIRARRKQVEMSQTQLGEKLGLTFQQVQKYEKGSNRVGASRLMQIAKALDTTTNFFFEYAPGGGNDKSVEGLQGTAFTKFMGEYGGAELLRYWDKLSTEFRRTLIDMARVASKAR